MKKSEMTMLLAYKHSVEGRGEPTKLDVESWHLTVGDLDYEAAMEAARGHYRDAETDHNGNAPRLMPRHLVEACEEPVHSSSWAGNITEQRLARERGELTA